MRALEHDDIRLWWRLPCQVQHQRVHPAVHGLQGVLHPLLQLGFVHLCGCYAILSNEEFASIVPLSCGGLVHPGSSLRGRLKHAAELHRLSSEPCLARASRCDFFRWHEDDAPRPLWCYGNRGLKLQAGPSWWWLWREEGCGGEGAKKRRRLTW